VLIELYHCVTNGGKSMNTVPLCAAFLLSGLVARAGAQAPPKTSTQAAGTDSSSAAEMDRRGDQGMGFRHDLTNHHFRLFADGGAIEVEADRPEDNASKEGIRRHLASIAERFAQGDFSLPMFIHATVPPGVETLRRLKGEITYTAENTPKGAQVRIATTNPEALAAIHEFLRFQIRDHRTGDPLEVTAGPVAHTAGADRGTSDARLRGFRPNDLWH
jgi:hypothetical protein